MSNGKTLNELEKPPWYIVRYKGRWWNRKEWNYLDFLNGGGPPKLFLTKRMAEDHAEEVKSEYGGTYINGPLIVEVVKVNIGKEK